MLSPNKQKPFCLRFIHVIIKLYKRALAKILQHEREFTFDMSKHFFITFARHTIAYESFWIFLIKFHAHTARGTVWINGAFMWAHNDVGHKFPPKWRYRDDSKLSGRLCFINKRSYLEQVLTGKQLNFFTYRLSAASEISVLIGIRVCSSDKWTEKISVQSLINCSHSKSHEIHSHNGDLRFNPLDHSGFISNAKRSELLLLDRRHQTATCNVLYENSLRRDSRSFN